MRIVKPWSDTLGTQIMVVVFVIVGLGMIGFGCSSMSLTAGERTSGAVQYCSGFILLALATLLNLQTKK